MKAKGLKFLGVRDSSLETPVIFSRKKKKLPTPSTAKPSPSSNTAYEAVSRKSSTKRLRLLIKESKRTLKSLQESEEKLRLFNHQLSSISQNTCSVIGLDFFNNLVQSLASVFGVRYAFIGKVTGTGETKIKTLAFWDGNKVAKNIVYDLKGTPCEKVIDINTCYVSHAVQEQFPGNDLLVELGIESYLGVPMYNAEKKLLGLLAIMDERPITHYEHYSSILHIFAARCASEIERMNAEAQLESTAMESKKSHQALKDFLSIASHDLRSPLAKIGLFGSRLAEKADGLNPESKEYLRRMQKITRSMQYLLDDLMLFSQVTTQKEPFKIINLATVLKEVIMSLDMSPHKNGGQILVGPLPKIEGNFAQLTQLFRNLLSNAIKFHEEEKPPKIEICSQPCKQGGWEISIKDQGIGFDEKYKERIFRPFERLHGKNEFEGTGMGLAICQKIAENHRGTIQAQSQPGEGSCFTVVFPTINNEPQT